MNDAQPPAWLAMRFNTLTRRLCRVAGMAGLLICGYALIDPSILPAVDAGNPLAPPSPRWRAAFGLVMSMLVFSYGLRPQAHREHARNDRSDDAQP